MTRAHQIVLFSDSAASKSSSRMNKMRRVVLDFEAIHKKEGVSRRREYLARSSMSESYTNDKKTLSTPIV